MYERLYYNQAVSSYFHRSWLHLIGPEFAKGYMPQLIRNIKRNRQTLVPTPGQVFEPFRAVSFDDVRVVIITEEPTTGSYRPHLSQQGVLQVGWSLTAKRGKRKAHRRWDWPMFTSQALQVLSFKRKHLVFIIQTRKTTVIRKAILQKRKGSHLILEGDRPEVYQKANRWLKKRNLPEIQWESKMSGDG